MDGATGKNLLENRAPAFGVVGLNEERAQFQRSGHGNLLLGNESEAWHTLEVAGIVRNQRHGVLQGRCCDPGISYGHGLASHRAAREFRPSPGELLVEWQNDESGMNKAFQR